MEANIYLNGLKIENAKNTDNILEIEGYICHWDDANLNHERVNSQTFDKFFELYNANKLRPRLNYEHTDQIIGGVDEIVPFDRGLYMTAHLAKNVAIVRDTIIPLIETGDLCSFSTECAVNYNDIEELQDNTYILHNAMLVGVAVVSQPADPLATFSLKNFINEYKLQKQAEQEKINNSNSKFYLFF